MNRKILIPLIICSTLKALPPLDQIGDEAIAVVLSNLPAYDFTKQNYPIRAKGTSPKTLQDLLQKNIDTLYTLFGTGPTEQQESERENSALMLLLLQQGISIIENALLRLKNPSIPAFASTNDLIMSLGEFKRFSAESDMKARNNAKKFFDAFSQRIEKLINADLNKIKLPKNADTLRNVYSQALLIHAVDDALGSDPEVSAELFSYVQDKRAADSDVLAFLQKTDLFSALSKGSVGYHLAQLSNSLSALARKL